MKTLRAYFLGRRPYGTTFALMEGLFEARQAGEIGDVVLLLEHEPVITTGRGAKAEHVLASREFLEARGIEFHDTRRGGDVTVHAPGQLICYPILDLKPDRADVRAYVQTLTRVMQSVVAPFGIASGTIPNMIGLWADQARPSVWEGPEQAEVPVKLGAIGVRISRWVTSHGFALNLSTDLSIFSLIVPCGISEYGVASVTSLTGRAPTVHEGARVAAHGLAREFERDLKWTELTSLGEGELDSAIRKEAASPIGA